MNEQQYIKITSYFRKTKLREKIVIYLCKYTPLIVAFCYFATLAILLISKNWKQSKCPSLVDQIKKLWYSHIKEH